MSESWKGRSKGRLSGYQFFAFLIKKIGVRSAYYFLKVVALYYFLFSPKAFRTIHYYFRERLQFSKLKSLSSIYQNYVWFGQTLLDKFIIIAGIQNKITFDFDGEHHLHQMAKDGNGGFMISAHLGNWEIAGFLLKRVESRFNILMYENEREEIKEYLNKNYQQDQVNFIFIKQDLSHIFEINNAVKNGEIICVHGDRFIPGSKTFKADFLGKEARFPAGPFEMAYKLKVPCCFVFAVKENDDHYHFFSNTPSIETQSAEHTFNRYVDTLENMVRRYPKQWFNYYDFWGH